MYRFLSTPSARRATQKAAAAVSNTTISIHALREEGDSQGQYHPQGWEPISIHALREEGDWAIGARDYIKWDISIHALREEGDQRQTVWKDVKKAISIHALREEGDLRLARTSLSSSISIHALREEGDLISLMGLWAIKQFLSTPSARRATDGAITGFDDFVISIHALREEGDATTAPLASPTANFYPRPPRGGRRAFWTPA